MSTVHWKISRLVAIQQLLKDGVIETVAQANLYSLQRICRLLGLRTPDGCSIKGRLMGKHALVAWFNTGHRIVAVPERYGKFEYVP